MKFYLTVDRAAAIAAGQETFGTVEFAASLEEFSAEERTCLARAYKETPHELKAPGIDLRYMASSFMGVETLRESQGGPSFPYPVFIEPSVAVIKDLVLRAKAQDAKQAEERIRKTAELLNESLKNCRDAGRWYPLLRNGYGQTPSPTSQLNEEQLAMVMADPEVIAAKTKAEARLADEKETQAARAKAEAEAKAQQQREERDFNAARAGQLVAWVHNYGTDSQKKRLARNMLPEDEILLGIRNQVFAPIEDINPIEATNVTRYKKMTATEVYEALAPGRNEYHSVEDVKFRSEVLDTLTESQFEVVECFEALIPGSKCEVIRHFGYFDGDESADPEHSRFGVKVTVQVGVLKLSREYAI